MEKKLCLQKACTSMHLDKKNQKDSMKIDSVEAYLKFSISFGGQLSGGDNCPLWVKPSNFKKPHYDCNVCWIALNDFNYWYFVTNCFGKIAP